MRETKKKCEADIVEAPLRFVPNIMTTAPANCVPRKLPIICRIQLFVTSVKFEP